MNAFWASHDSMIRQGFAMLSSVVLLVSPAFSAHCASLSSPSGSVLATRVNLVVFNVMVQDKVTGDPLESLHAEDFEVFDDRRLARLSVFLQDPKSNTDAIMLWLVGECPQKSPEESSSTFPVDKFLEPALKQMNPADTIGVAHWCGDKGGSGIDLATTKDPHAATVALKGILGLYPRESHNSTSTLQEILSLIHRQTSNSALEPRPVVVFLGSNGASLPQKETALLAREVVSHTSLTVFAINGPTPRSTSASLSRLSPMAFLCKETGGQVLSTDGNDWGEALARIVNGFHSRYMLAFVPSRLDGKWHTVEIKLTGDAVRKHPASVLRYRSGYFGGVPARFSISETPFDGQWLSNPQISQLIEKSVGQTEIPFEAEGATYEGTAVGARFTLKLGDERLSWTDQADGSHRSEITLVTAFLSADGEGIEHKMQRYKIVRSKDDSWISPNQRIIITSFFDCPPKTDHIRFVIRDDASGRIGEMDLPMQKVLDAPKLRSVIY